MKLIGTFEMPCTFSCPKKWQAHGKSTGRDKNEWNCCHKDRLSFYTTYSVQINLKEQSTDTVKPTVTYDPATRFVWMEDFENGGSSLVKTSHSDTVLRVVSGGSNVLKVLIREVFFWEIQSSSLNAVTLAVFSCLYKTGIS